MHYSNKKSLLLKNKKKVKGGYYLYPSLEELKTAEIRLGDGLSLDQISILNNLDQNNLNKLIKLKAAELFGPTASIKQAAAEKFGAIKNTLNNAYTTASNTVAQYNPVQSVGKYVTSVRDKNTTQNDVNGRRAFNEVFCSTAVGDKIEKALGGYSGTLNSFQIKRLRDYLAYIRKVGHCNDTNNFEIPDSEIY